MKLPRGIAHKLTRYTSGGRPIFISEIGNAISGEFEAK